MTTDAQRHANKIRKFENAVQRVGATAVCNKIGQGAFSSFVSAQDAQIRKQNPSIIASFISDGQARGDVFCNLQDDESIYDVFASLK